MNSLSRLNPSPRLLALAAFLTAAFAAQGAAAQSIDDITLNVYKEVTCACCVGWIEHMDEHGYESTVHHPPDLNQVKLDLGLRPQFHSCHTAVTDSGLSVRRAYPREVHCHVPRRPAGKRHRAVGAGNAHRRAGNGNRRPVSPPTRSCSCTRTAQPRSTPKSTARPISNPKPISTTTPDLPPPSGGVNSAHQAAAAVHPPPHPGDAPADRGPHLKRSGGRSIGVNLASSPAGSGFGGPKPLLAARRTIAGTVTGGRSASLASTSAKRASPGALPCRCR